MGYIVTGNYYRNTKELYDAEISKSFAVGIEIIDVSIKNNAIFMLIQNTLSEKKEKSIMMAKIIKIKGRFGYNIFSESYKLFINLVGCPERILSRSEANDEVALQWRADNRRFKAYYDKYKKEKLLMKKGDLYKVGGNEVEFLCPYTVGQFVGRDIKKDQEFRYKYTSVNWNLGRLN